MKYGVKSHKVIVFIFIIITLFTLMRQWMYGSWHGMRAMTDFMAGFFLIFGFFKIINIKGFAQAYKKYNLVARYIPAYAYAIPFIQMGIGFTYLTRHVLLFSNVINFIIMSIGFVSVLVKLIKKEIIPCACLGTFFRHPLSIMSLFEQVLMVGMSLSMVIYHSL